MKVKESRRIGIFGGTFDPPHVGHLIIAEQACHQLNLDKVIFVPAFIPPHKRSESDATPAQRHQMVKLAVQGNRCFDVSQIELKRKGVSYTVDTLSSMRSKYPRVELFLILGSDNFVDFASWQSPSEILSIATLAVYKRKGFETPSKELIANLNPIELSSSLLDVSSSGIRRRIREGSSIKYLVPGPVERFIGKYHLYATQR